MKFGFFLKNLLIGIFIFCFNILLSHPTILDINPSNGNRGGGTLVNIMGSGFSQANLMSFGGTNVSFVVINDSLIQAVSPPSVPIVANVIVSTPLESSDITPTSQFTYTGNWICYIPAFSGLIPLNIPSDKIDSRILTKGLISEVVITPDGRFAYALNKTDLEIQVINLETKSLIHAIKLVDVDDLSGIAINSSGTRVYVCAKNNLSAGSLIVIDTSTNLAIERQALGSSPIHVVLQPHGTQAFVLCSTQIERYEISTDHPQLLSITSLGQEPFDIAVHPSKLQILVTFPTIDAIGLFDFAKNSTEMIPGVLFPLGIAITPDGSMAYAVSRPKNIMNTLTPIDLTTDVPTLGQSFIAGRTGAEPTYISITPNGREAYISQFGDFSVAHIDLKSESLIGTRSFGVVPYKIAISPDQAPQAKFTYTPAAAGRPITFDASLSISPAGKILKYCWDFGTGVQQVENTPIINYTYPCSGIYTVTLTVENETGKSSHICYNVQVDKRMKHRKHRLPSPTNIKVKTHINRKNKYVDNIITWSVSKKKPRPMAYALYRDRHLKKLVAKINPIKGYLFRRYYFKDRQDREKFHSRYYLVAIGKKGERSKTVKIKLHH